MAERSRGSQLPGTYAAQRSVPLIAANTEDELVIWKNNTGASVKVTLFGYLPDTALTGADTNSLSLQGKVKTAAGGAAANLTAVKAYTSGVDIVQFVEDALVLSTTAADLQVDDGETVTLDVTMPGTGLQFEAGIITVKFQYV